MSWCNIVKDCKRFASCCCNWRERRVWNRSDKRFSCSYLFLLSISCRLNAELSNVDGLLNAWVGPLKEGGLRGGSVSVQIEVESGVPLRSVTKGIQSLDKALLILPFKSNSWSWRCVILGSCPHFALICARLIYFCEICCQSAINLIIRKFRSSHIYIMNYSAEYALCISSLLTLSPWLVGVGLQRQQNKLCCGRLRQANCSCARIWYVAIAAAFWQNRCFAWLCFDEMRVLV